MLLTLDISNTSIKAGVFRGDELLANWRIATERHKLTDDYGMLLLNLLQASGIPASEITGVSLSCVVPPLRPVFEDVSRKYLHRAPVIVGPGIKTGVKLVVDNPREVGADRVVNSLATYRQYGGPAIAIAFGTATVFDCISAANATTLQELGAPSPRPSPSKGEGVLLSMAVRVGKPRLIDNFLYKNGQRLTGEVARV